MNDQMIAKMLQFTHLEKLYDYLPGMPDVLPALFGMTPQAYADALAGFDRNAREAAQELLADPQVAALVDQLPFTSGQTVLAVGDSITDDAQSWAEILRHLIDLRLPERGVTVVNGGLSAHTTAMVLRRWPATLASTRPDWIICGLGGNDVTRVGPEPATTQVGLGDSVTNLRRLREIASGVRWLWLSPVPVHEERVAQFPPFRFGESTWRNADLVALATALPDTGDPVVDLVATFGTPADPELQGPDGVHPSIAGQRAIATAVVTALAAHPG